MLNVPVNNFSVMKGQSHRFLGITSIFFFFFFFFFLGGGGGVNKYALLKNTTRPDPSWEELKGYVCCGAKIADMRIRFQIIYNCYTEVFDVFFNIFKNCCF